MSVRTLLTKLARSFESFVDQKILIKDFLDPEQMILKSYDHLNRMHTVSFVIFKKERPSHS